MGDDDMGTNVMSDIHGCFTAFQEMLKKINFNYNDRLIIAGDMIDRGPENLEMLKWMEKKPENVEILMGNHEYDFAFEYVPEILERMYSFGDHNFSKLRNVDPYYDPYGTIRELKKRGVAPERLEYWANIMRDFPYYRILTVSERRYIIVHAAYISREKYKKLYGTLRGLESEYIWNRYAFMYDEGKGDTLVFGHTPTIASEGYFADGNIFKADHNGNRFINIDCGYVHRNRYPNAKLAAIRLEDEAEFYVSECYPKKST